MSLGGLGAARLGVDGRDAHVSHQALHVLAVDGEAPVLEFEGNAPASQEGPDQMKFVDGAHDRQLLL